MVDLFVVGFLSLNRNRFAVSNVVEGMTADCGVRCGALPVQGGIMRGDSWDYGPSRWHDSGDLLVRVRAQRFRKFSRWMDRRLAKLVDRWAHSAVPSAVRPARPPLSKSKPK